MGNERKDEEERVAQSQVLGQKSGLVTKENSELNKANELHQKKQLAVT